MTVSESRGIVTSMFFRLCSRAPRTTMAFAGRTTATVFACSVGAIREPSIGPDTPVPASEFVLWMFPRPWQIPPDRGRGADLGRGPDFGSGVDGLLTSVRYPKALSVNKGAERWLAASIR